MTTASFGHGRERAIKKLLEDQGWWVMRAPASLGYADLVALKAGETPRLIEVKGNIGSPYKSFLPTDRMSLSLVAHLAGARAQLAHWPKRGELRWIEESEWP
jgi:Holliday junction resolvase